MTLCQALSLITAWVSKSWRKIAYRRFMSLCLCLPSSFPLSVFLPPSLSTFFYIEKRILKDLRWHVLEIVLLVTLDLKRTVTLSRTGQHPVTGVSGHKGRGARLTRWAVRGPEQEQEEEELFKIPREKIRRLSQGTQDKYLTNNFLYKNITSHMIPFLLFKNFFQSWKRTSASQCGEVEHVIGLWDAAGGLLLPWTAQNSHRVRVSPQGIAAADKHSLTLNLSDPRDRWIKEILQRGLHLIAIITIDCNNTGIVFYETQLNLCSKNCIRSEILRAGFLCTIPV